MRQCVSSREIETETEGQSDRDRDREREDGSLNKNSRMATDTPMYTSIHTPMLMHSHARSTGDADAHILHGHMQTQWNERLNHVSVT